jgi:ATP-dependent DNA helicase RecG
MKYPDVESHLLEFKRELPQNDQIVKTVIGFCNQAGGSLIIGVDDDGTIVGLPEDEVMQVIEWMEPSVYQSCSPPIIPKVLAQRIANKLILVITVSSGMNKPYYRTSEGLEKGTYIRIGRSTIRATADMIEELKWQSRGLSFDAMPVYQAKINDLNSDKINDFLESRRQKAKVKVDNEILRSYKLVTEEHSQEFPTVAGVLLFGKDVNFFFSEAMIICTHFSGTSERNVIATRDCIGNLFEQFSEAYHFILSQLNRSFKIIGPRRDEQLEIPESAIRELLLNAIVHRNYHLRSPSKIAIYEDRIEIFSPGGFPTPFPNILQGLTDARNMTICKVFREAQYIEKLGSGIIEAFESYAKAGLSPPEIINNDNHVKCILPRGTYRMTDVRDEMQPILELCRKVRDVSMANIIEMLHLPRTTAKRYLAVLLKQEKIVRLGQGKGTRYRLK